MLRLSSLSKTISALSSRTWVAAVTTAATKATGKTEEQQQFVAVFPSIVHDLTELCNEVNEPQLKIWYSKVLEHNVPHGKLWRGTSTVNMFKTLKKNQTQESLRLAFIAGWCIELLQAHYTVTDDMIDASTTRRGRLSWYKTHNLGLQAFRDSLFMKFGIYALLRKYFRNQPYYLDLVDLFHETNRYSTLGQALDINCLGKDGNPLFELFTLDRYHKLIAYKTAYYTCTLPLLTSLLLAGLTNQKLVDDAIDISQQMGSIFQIQDDFLDCYGDPAITGKIGTDIEDGKCTWFVVKALESATPLQINTIKENYGQCDSKKVAVIKAIYNELGLKEAYHLHEKERFSKINHQIEQSPHNELFKEVTKVLFEPFYKRSK